jgi:RecA-family ATPase
MHNATESSLGLKDFQSHGYAEVYARNNKKHFKDDPFVFVPPTIEEMESAYSSASRDEYGDLRIRGVTYGVDLSTSDLLYKAIAFRPDANGEELYVEPVSEGGRIIDLIWSTDDLDDWGFTTGRGAVLGAENLSKTYSAELPLHVYNDLHRYWGHVGDEDLAKEDAVCILKRSARALLPTVGHVQVFWWDDVEALAEEFFRDHPERVSAFQDQEAFDAFVKRAALWERFDNMQRPTPPAGPRLTWAHAKVAVKARRKVNAETGLDGFEEFRARVRAHAALPEVRGAIDVWREDPSDENRLLAQDACMPFSLRDIVFTRMTQFVSFDEWKRRQESAEPDASTAESRCDPLIDFMFDGDVAPAPPSMLIKRLLPAQGVCFNGGQSGVGKTFIMCHAAACLASGEPFFGHRVYERVGSAIFAAEGAFTMPNRIAVARQRITDAPKLPISWLGNVPNLSDRREIVKMIPRLKALSARFGDEFGVRLGAVFIDTLSAACDVQDENDNSEAAKIGRGLQYMSAEIGIAVVPSHHYGKNQETGLRGASATRAYSDVVWSAMGDRNQLTGDIKNRQFAITKSREDVEGVISGFDIKFVELGKDKHGDPFGACYVVEKPFARAAKGVDIGDAVIKFEFKKPGTTDAMGIKALAQAIKDHGYLPLDHEDDFPDVIPTVSLDQWRAEYDKIRPGDDDANRQAFNRLSKKLVKSGHVNARPNRFWLP